MASEIKPSSANGVIVTITLLLALAALVWLFGMNGSAQVTAPVTAKTPLGNELAEARQFIWFNSTKASFQYPVGYFVEGSGFETDVVFKAYASLPGQQPEVLELVIDNTTTASAAFGEFRNDIDANAGSYAQTKISSFTNSRGKLVRVLSATTLSSVLPELTNASTHVTMAFFDCRDEEGESYTALFSAFIPTTWQSDAALFQKTIDTFSC